MRAALTVTVGRVIAYLVAIVLVGLAVLMVVHPPIQMVHTTTTQAVVPVSQPASPPPAVAPAEVPVPTNPVTPAPPVWIEVPGMPRITMNPEGIDLDSNGQIHPADLREVAWWRVTPLPGTTGTLPERAATEIDGHNFYDRQNPPPFSVLPYLQKGQQVRIGLQNGDMAVYSVVEVFSYDKNQPLKPTGIDAFLTTCDEGNEDLSWFATLDLLSN